MAFTWTVGVVGCRTDYRVVPSVIQPDDGGVSTLARSSWSRDRQVQYRREQAEAVWIERALATHRLKQSSALSQYAVVLTQFRRESVIRWPGRAARTAADRVTRAP